MDKKIIIGIILSTLLLLGGAVWLLGNSSSKAVVTKTLGGKIETQEVNFDFKDIPYSGGNATHSFKIKNGGDKDLQIANMASSCMCTTVSLKTLGGVSPKFGMKGHSPASSWTGKLAPGEEAEVVAEFDPTAHGPSGVGPMERMVSFETSDPSKPYVEFSFKGVVVK